MKGWKRLREEKVTSKQERIERVVKLTQSAETDRAVLRAAAEKLHPADLAEALNRLGAEERERLFNVLALATAAQALDEADPATQDKIVKATDTQRLIGIVEELPPDEGADLLERMPEAQEAQVLRGVEDDLAEDLRELLEHDPETAGGLMTTEFVALSLDDTAASAVKRLQGATDAEDVLNNLFVVDDARRLRGVVPLCKLIAAKPDTAIQELMEPDVIHVTTDVDREEVARQVERYDVHAMPVLDAAGVMRGLITVDDVLEAISEEVSEDMYRIAGTWAMHPTRERPLKRMFLRFPWLGITVASGLFTAWVYGLYRQQLAGQFAVACFVPLIMAMGGNVALQSSTIMVRGLATGEVELGRIFRLLLGEVSVGAMLGVACGVLTGLAAAWLNGDPRLGVVIALSMTIGLTVAATLGTVMPLLCSRFGIDPALAAGPFVTSLNDLTGLVIYLTIACLLIVHMA